MKNLINEIETITKGERFITTEQLELIACIDGIFVENCGTSGTGEGILYTFWEMDNYGEKTDNEVCELVITD